MSGTQTALVSIYMDFIGGQDRLQTVVTSFRKIGKIAGISSVYKKYLHGRTEDLNSELVLALQVETTQDLAETFAFLKELESLNRGRARGQFVLLAFDHEIRLVPGENLPSPLLHTDNLTLRCAAEAWGSYRHPVLGQTLNELVRSNQPLPHVEFYAQGRSLYLPESL